MFYVFHNGMLKRILRFGFSAPTGTDGGADCARTGSMDGGVGLLCRKNRCTLLVVALTPRSLSQSAISANVQRLRRSSLMVARYVSSLLRLGLTGADCASVNNESVDDCDIVFSSFAITSRSRMVFFKKTDGN